MQTIHIDFSVELSYKQKYILKALFEQYPGERYFQKQHDQEGNPIEGRKELKVEVGQERYKVKLHQSLVRVAHEENDNDVEYAVKDNNPNATLGAGVYGKAKTSSSLVRVKFSNEIVTSLEVEKANNVIKRLKQKDGDDDLEDKANREAEFTHKITGGGSKQAQHVERKNGLKSYILMDKVEGEPLWSSMSKINKLQKIQLLKHSLMAINLLHGKGISHSDAHNDNILVNAQGGQLEVKLIDFGLSQYKNELTAEKWEAAMINDFRYILAYYIAPLCSNERSKQIDIGNEAEMMCELPENVQEKLESCGFSSEESEKLIEIAEKILENEDGDYEEFKTDFEELMDVVEKMENENAIPDTMGCGNQIFKSDKSLSPVGNRFALFEGLNQPRFETGQRFENEFNSTLIDNPKFGS